MFGRFFRRFRASKQPVPELSPFPELQADIGPRYRLTSEIDSNEYLALGPFEEEFRIRLYRGSNDEYSARLHRVIEASRTLSHPSLAPLIDGGRTSGGSWAASREVKGESLAARLEEGPHPVEPVIGLLRDLVPALDVAHAKGIVHGDWLAGNIVFDGMRWVITQFGFPPGWARHDQLRVASPAIPAVFALSPECITGARANPASDFYSLGALLFYFSAGRAPFGDDKGNVMLSILRVLNELPPPLREIRPDLPEDLAQLVHLLLLKDPEERLNPEVRTLIARLTGDRRPPEFSSGPEVNLFLSNLRQDGCKTDSGKFTLNPEKALDKLQKFQFRRPHHFLLPLLVAAAKLEATGVEIKASEQGLSLQYHSPTLSPPHLENLFLVAAQGDKRSPLVHLGLGIVGAFAAGASKVQLSSGRKRAILKGVEKPRLSRGGSSGVTLDIEGDLISRQALQEIKRLIRYGAIPIIWNGEDLTADRAEFNESTRISIEGESFLVEACFHGRESGLSLRVDGLCYDALPEFVLPQTRVVVDGPWSVDLSYQVGLENDLRRMEVEELAGEWLLNAATYRTLESPIDFARSRFYLSLLSQVTDAAHLELLSSRVIEARSAPAAREQYSLHLENHIGADPDTLKLLEHACRYIRLNKNFASFQWASRILSDPLIFDDQDPKSWETTLNLADDAFPQKGDIYWLFLLRSWVRFDAIHPPLEWVLPLLSRLGLIPKHERYQWDRPLMNRLASAARQTPEKLQEVARDWGGSLPKDGFSVTRQWCATPTLE
jgi:serine/threonine protein kinase